LEGWSQAAANAHAIFFQPKNLLGGGEGGLGTALKRVKYFQGDYLKKKKKNERTQSSLNLTRRKFKFLVPMVDAPPPQKKPVLIAKLSL